MDEIFSFGEWIRRRRKARDLTQDALARQVGCALSMIRKIEADERRPSRQIAELLADALAVPAAERGQFLRTARAELAADQLSPPVEQGSPPIPGAPPAPTSLPSGTVTFLFTDLVGSTRLWEQHPQAMPPALARHDAILHTSITGHGGMVVKTTGDGIHAVFARATDALVAAYTAQQALTSEPWGGVGTLQVRMVLHSGLTAERAGDYYGPVLNRAARLLAIAHGGQVLLSRAAQELVADHLPPEMILLDLGEHLLRDLSRSEQIFQLIAPGLPTAFAPLASLSPRVSTNLPIALSSFIGREAECTAIAELLATQRFVTLTGPGGTGKTRLVLQVGATVQATFPHGVWLIELAPLADPALVPQAVASVLGLREEAGRPLQTVLTDYLHTRTLLLVLDNCEHLVDTCAQLTETLLRTCPQLRVLASSREALGIAGEASFRVPPLRTPDPRHLPQLEAFAQYEAVRLFDERARSVLPSFRITPENMAAVAQICVRLDGIPLAIELAAARVAMLRVEQIAARLNDRFRLLTGASRTAMPRQQTLRALIDWSYDLLSPPEQVLLQRLAVFAGGWTLAAAEAVGAAENQDQYAVLDLLTQLVNKSLVLVDRELGHEARYRLLETIRQYALERLAANGEADSVRRRHAEYCMAFAEEACQWLGHRGQSPWLAKLHLENDNMRAALGWALGGDAEVGARIAIALAGPESNGYWVIAETWQEGWHWLQVVLEQRDQLSHEITGWALLRATWYAWLCGVTNPTQPIAGLEDARQLFSTVGNLSGLAATHASLGIRPWLAADYSLATQHYQAAITQYRELDNRFGIANMQYMLGTILRDQGDISRAIPTLEDCLAFFRDNGDIAHGVRVCLVLGEIACLQMNYAHARALYWEAIALNREIENRWEATWVLRALGWLEMVSPADGSVRAILEEQVGWYREKSSSLGLISLTPILSGVLIRHGTSDQALEILQEGLLLQQQLGQRQLLAESLMRYAWVAAEQQQPEQAARLLGSAEILKPDPWRPGELPVVDMTIALVRAQLSSEAFDTAWAAGQEMSLDQAIAEALALTDSPASADG